MEDLIFLEKIRREFPDLRWQSARKTDGNWDFDVFILDEKYVFRFAKDKEGEKNLEREIKLTDYLNKKKTKVAVPDYIFRSHDGKFAGYKMIKGYELTNKIFSKLTEKEKKDIAKDIADFLSVLHQTPKRLFPKFGLKEENDLIKREKRLQKRLKKTVFSKIKESETNDIEGFFDEFKKMSRASYKKVLTHGDLTSDNIIFEKGKIRGVIDFGNLGVYDPAVDFKGFWRFGKYFVEMIYKNYYNHKDPKFFDRVRNYRRVIGLYVLDGAMNYKHSPINFEKGYKLFRKIFYC